MLSASLPIAVDVDLSHRLRLCPSGFSTIESPLFPLSILDSSEGVTTCSRTSGVRSYAPPPMTHFEVLFVKCVGSVSTFILFIFLAYGCLIAPALSKDYPFSIELPLCLCKNQLTIFAWAIYFTLKVHLRVILEKIS